MNTQNPFLLADKLVVEVFLLSQILPQTTSKYHILKAIFKPFKFTPEHYKLK